MKNYLLTLLQNCSEENFGQEAVEWGIVQGHVKLTYNLQTDLHQIFDRKSACCDAPPHPGVIVSHQHTGMCRQCLKGTAFSTLYDQLIVGYRQQCQEHGDALARIYESSGLLEEILRPIAITQTTGTVTLPHETHQGRAQTAFAGR